MRRRTGGDNKEKDRQRQWGRAAQGSEGWVLLEEDKGYHDLKHNLEKKDKHHLYKKDKDKCNLQEEHDLEHELRKEDKIGLV